MVCSTFDNYSILPGKLGKFPLGRSAEILQFSSEICFCFCYDRNSSAVFGFKEMFPNIYILKFYILTKSIITVIRCRNG